MLWSSSRYNLSIFAGNLNMSSPANTEKPTLVAVKGEGPAEEKQNASSVVSDDSFANPTGINEKALVRKLDWRLLPTLTLLYLLSFLDRSNSM